MDAIKLADELIGEAYLNLVIAEAVLRRNPSDIEALFLKYDTLNILMKPEVVALLNVIEEIDPNHYQTITISLSH